MSFALTYCIQSQEDTLSDGLNIAHQLGHSLGFGHDDAPEYAGHNCDCNCAQNGKCLMAASLSDVKCHRLSNCSRVIYHDLIRQPGKECLLNLPTGRFKPKICGNGVIDENEECDCGLDEECRRHSCCQKNCTIKQDIDCIYGLCCEKCKFLEEGTLCRAPVTECDLPEYCNGTSASCPADVHKQDGMPCGTADTCYTGKCLSLQKQCTDIFGHGTRPAPLICFKQVNMQGDRSGNCGKERFLRFKKCNEEDVPCGRVQCTHVSKLPKMPTGQGVVQTTVEDTLCWGTEFHLGEDVYDVGAVRDGTTCGINRICINRSCVHRAVLKYDCDFSKCNNRGLCNSKRNCHCQYGWAPPFCKITGFGGSVDSGPPPHASSHFRLW
ncbi:disintegrin and metalloproteinase domain-containing protein 30-like [Elgaria multicarinata webbii]|uniref:disintegrin and metalloproteinase domain-containing protein 30-like n=1 Tax=Elgaria multicarinata webbii TaxID=159646 RepID=UPI002FCCE476